MRQTHRQVLLPAVAKIQNLIVTAPTPSTAQSLSTWRFPLERPSHSVITPEYLAHCQPASIFTSAMSYESEDCIALTARTAADSAPLDLTLDTSLLSHTRQRSSSAPIRVDRDIFARTSPLSADTVHLGHSWLANPQPGIVSAVFPPGHQEPYPMDLGNPWELGFTLAHEHKYDSRSSTQSDTGGSAGTMFSAEFPTSTPERQGSGSFSSQ
jgi:hypothetical protein